jgi:hypothetical protein
MGDQPLPPVRRRLFIRQELNRHAAHRNAANASGMPLAAEPLLVVPEREAGLGLREPVASRA